MSLNEEQRLWIAPRRETGARRDLLDLFAPAQYQTPMKTPRQQPPQKQDRNERLKAALKANMGRRKAQARARAAATDGDSGKEQKE